MYYSIVGKSERGANVKRLANPKDIVYTRISRYKKNPRTKTLRLVSLYTSLFDFRFFGFEKISSD